MFLNKIYNFNFNFQIPSHKIDFEEKADKFLIIIPSENSGVTFPLRCMTMINASQLIPKRLSSY